MITIRKETLFQVLQNNNYAHSHNYAVAGLLNYSETQPVASKPFTSQTYPLQLAAYYTRR